MNAQESEKRMLSNFKAWKVCSNSSLLSRCCLAPCPPQECVRNVPACLCHDRTRFSTRNAIIFGPPDATWSFALWNSAMTQQCSKFRLQTLSMTVTTSQRWQCNGCAMLCTTWELWLGSRNEHHLSSQSVNIFEPSASLSWRTSVPSGWSGHIGHHSLSTNSPVACCQGMYNCNMPETLL